MLIYTMLYEFTLGDKVWRYTSNAEDVIDPSNNVWEACAISDDGVSTSGEAATDNLTVNCPDTLVPARLFMYSPPSAVMDFRILTADFNEKLTQGEFSGVDSSEANRVIPVYNTRVRYVGEVVQCGYPAPGQASFTMETLAATMRREGLRLFWMRSCPHAVYDPSTCKLDKTPLGVSATITAISGNLLTLTAVNGYPSGHFRGGLLAYNHPIKGIEYLTIETHGGSLVSMFDSVGDLWVDMQVTVYPGCDQTPQRCQSLGNYPNYGGVPALPGKSPFNGVDSPVF